MKISLKLILFIFLVSCENSNTLEKYKDFTYEFRDKSEYFYSSEEINSWFEDGKKISLKPYLYLFSDSIKAKSSSLKEIKTLGRFIKITAKSDFDLFIAKSDSNYIFIVGNKSPKTIVDVFVPTSKLNLETIRYQDNSHYGKRVLITFSERIDVHNSQYDEITPKFFDVNYILNENGKISFAEKEQNEYKTFEGLPEKFSSSGKYEKELKNHTIWLTTKDPTKEGKLPFKFSILDKKSGSTLTHFETETINENTIKKFWKEEELYNFTFENGEVLFYYNDCRDSLFDKGFCEIKTTLTKK